MDRGATRRAVRIALLMLMEDPPLGLGGSRLAEYLLPNERDTFQRGMRLQRMLREAIDRLRPGVGAPDPGDRRWRAYLIHAGEHVEGCPREDIRGELNISLSTYGHAKHYGLETITSLLFYTDSGREESLKQLLGDNVIGAMDRLRAAVQRYAHNPHSARRQEQLMQCLEDVMAEQINHLYSVCGTLVVGPIERMEGRLAELERNDHEK